MIPHSRLAACVALFIAGIFHAVALVDFETSSDVTMAGGAAVQSAALGNSFEDFTAGAIASIASPPTAQAIEPVTPTATRTVTETLALETVPNQTAKLAPSILTAVSPATPTSINLAEAPLETANVEPVRTPSIELNARLEPVEEMQPEPERQPSNAGNSDQYARKGVSSGRETAQSAAGSAKASPANSSEAGNGSLSNYMGKVFRQINRTRVRNSAGKGLVRVQFIVQADGALGAVNVQVVQGSRRGTRVTQEQLRKAAPFPKPPSGKPITLTLDIRLK